MSEKSAAIVNGLLGRLGMFRLPPGMRSLGYRTYTLWRPIYPIEKRGSNVVVLDTDHLCPSFSPRGFDILVFNERLELVDFLRGQRLGEATGQKEKGGDLLSTYKIYVGDPFGKLRLTLEGKGFAVRAGRQRDETETANYW